MKKSFFLLILAPILLFCSLNFALAAETQWKIPDPQIKIPGMEKFATPGPCPDDPSKKCVPWLGQYIAGVYKYAVAIVGILAVVVMMIGGFLWITAGGNTSTIAEAKNWIGGSLTGLILVMASYMILYYVNPGLVTLSPIKVTEVKKITVAAGANCTWIEDMVDTAGVGAGTICNDNKNLKIGEESKCGQKTSAMEDTEGTKWNCCCNINVGNCEVPTSGDCSVTRLEQIGGTCFGDDIYKMAAICNIESKGSANIAGKADFCKYKDASGNYQTASFSFGLFQVNAVNSAGSIPECNGAFTGYVDMAHCMERTTNTAGLSYCKYYDCQPQANAQRCIDALSVPENNVKAACTLYRSSGIRPWGAVTNKVCGF